jgi:hypothetical protein
MPWSIDGPSSEELGYLRYRKRRDTGGMGSRDTQARRSRSKWISIGVILALVALIGFYVAAVRVEVDRNELVADAVGTWVQSGSVGSVLVITKRPLDNVGSVTGELFFEGTIDRHEVRGAVGVPAFPSMSTTPHLTLLGQRWDLRLQTRNVMTLTNRSDRVITLWEVSD